MSSEHRLGNNAAKISRVVREWHAFVEGFFHRSPKGTFVFSPSIIDRKRDFILDFVKSWRHEKRFIFSKEDDNKYYLARSDFLLTDWSDIDGSWIFSTLRPAIYLRADEDAPLEEIARGYVASTGEDALRALAAAQKNLRRWKARLLISRIQELPFFGKSAATLCEAIRHIISSDFPEPLPTWTVFDKKITGQKPVIDLLRCHSLRKAHPQGLLRLSPAYIWPKVFRAFPQSGCLALAALDELLTYSSIVNLNELGKQKLFLYLKRAFELVPQHIVYKFLIHKLHKLNNVGVIIPLLCIAVSHSKGTEEQREYVGNILREGKIDPEKLSGHLSSFFQNTPSFSPEVCRQLCQAANTPPPGDILAPRSGDARPQ